MNWMQVEARVKHDDRCVLPIGSVEQHAYLSLCVDMILAEKVSVDAAAPLGVPVYPAVQEIDPAASHASWMENFPWTRLEGVAMPAGSKPVVDYAALQLSNPAEVRQIIGDGNFHGRYQRSDNETLALWGVAVEETRDIINRGWP